MGVLGDKLQEALNNKENYVWKGEKCEVAGEIMQPEIKLMTATPEQLNTFYQHCNSMLYNKDRKHPGRYVLLNMIQEQIDNCNIELCMRFIEGRYLNSTGRPIYPRFKYYNELKKLLDNNKVPSESYKDISIESVTNVPNFPAEFQDITVYDIQKAAFEALGVFDKSHLSTNFIAKLGIWFTPQERKELEEYDPVTGKSRDRLAVIRERHNISSKVKLKTNQAGLTYAELRSMLNLKTDKRYSELTTDQLVLLRNKVLFRFTLEVERHIKQWETRKAQIEEVCEARGIKLEEPNNE